MSDSPLSPSSAQVLTGISLFPSPPPSPVHAAPGMGEFQPIWIEPAFALQEEEDDEIVPQSQEADLIPDSESLSSTESDGESESEGVPATPSPPPRKRARC